MLQRFLPVLAQRIERISLDVDYSQLRGDYESLIRDLLALQPVTFLLSETAHDIVDLLLERLNRLEWTGDNLGEGFASFVGKLPAYVGALTVILHLILNPRLESFNRTHIAGDTASRTRTLIEGFILPHALEVYGQGEGTMDAIRRVASYILTSGKARIVASDLTSNNVAGLRGADTKAVADRVAPLVAGGWLEPEGKQFVARAWTVNRQAIDARFAAQAKTEEARKQAIAARLRTLRPDESVEDE